MYWLEGIQKCETIAQKRNKSALSIPQQAENLVLPHTCAWFNFKGGSLQKYYVQTQK